MTKIKGAIILGLLLIVGVPLWGLAEETALDRYVAKPDPAYGYTHYLTQRKCGCSFANARERSNLRWTN